MNLSGTSKKAADGGIIAAIYVVLSFISSSVGLCSGVIQLRLSEALCVLPIFTPAAIPGLTIGCVLTNLLTGGTLLDVIFGSLATLLGAIGTYYLRKRPVIASLSPVISNTIILPFVISQTMLGSSIGSENGINSAVIKNVLFGSETELSLNSLLSGTSVLSIAIIIAIEEFLACFVLGTLLRKGIEKYRNRVRITK